MPEYLAMFCNNYFEKDIKGKLDDEIDKILTLCVKVFSCLRNKDTFCHMYTKLQANRLL